MRQSMDEKLRLIIIEGLRERECVIVSKERERVRGRCFLNGPFPASFLFIIGLFQTNITNFIKKIM